MLVKVFLFLSPLVGTLAWDISTFDRDGYIIAKGFSSHAETDTMMTRMARLIDEWDPSSHLSTFQTDEGQVDAQGSDTYFLDSAEGIHFFLEPGALVVNGSLAMDKHLALNKVGHALHVKDPVFREYSQSDKVATLVRSLGWKAPVLPQSMYIFKQPEIGGEVTPHQDSTFLYTTPRPSCLGLWLALEDATLENGCLWARVGSHKEPVQRQFSRNPEYFEQGNYSAPMMTFKDLASDPVTSARPGSSVKSASEAREAGFVPLPVEKGDLVVIDGSIDHLSLPNLSGKSRHSFQLHLVEGPKAGVTWSPENWLQYKQGGFPELPTAHARSEL